MITPESGSGKKDVMNLLVQVEDNITQDHITALDYSKSDITADDF